MYDFDEHDVEDYDGYYEQDTYAGDRWGAWLDDTRLPYEPPHKEHNAAWNRAEWLAWVAKDDSNYMGLPEYAEMVAASECEDCREYAEAWAQEQAERRVGA